jgi:hypothetical protein
VRHRKPALHLHLAISKPGRPNFTPLALARSLPSPVLARISSRSNSAKPPRTVSISLPCGVVVSAQASFSDLKPARALAIASRMSWSRVERASRSNRVTTSTSPGASLHNALANSARSVFAPDTFSLNTLTQPAARSSASCETRSWPLVELGHIRKWSFPNRPIVH